MFYMEKNSKCTGSFFWGCFMRHRLPYFLWCCFWSPYFFNRRFVIDLVAKLVLFVPVAGADHSPPPALKSSLLSSLLPPPLIHSFFTRTSKLFLRLPVLNFFFIFEAEIFLICSYFPDWALQCLKEECQTEYIKKRNISFLSLFFFQAVTGRCSTKNRFCNFAKTNQKYLQRSSIFR